MSVLSIVFGRIIKALRQANLAKLRVVKRLVGVLILEAEPSLVVVLSLGALVIIDAHHQEDARVRVLFELTQLQFDLPVVVHLKQVVPKILEVGNALEIL